MKSPIPAVTALATLLLAGALAGCVDDGPTSDADHVALLTTEGCIVLELFPDDAPRTVANFVQYVEDGFYEGTRFHRIMQNFMIQGGGFDQDDMGNQKQTRDPIPLEYKVPNQQYTISMARTGDPNSATSQFFISTVDNTQTLGPNARSDGYAAFGQVVDGKDVVDKIAAHPTGPSPSNPDEISAPVNPEPRILEADTGDTCPNAPEPEEAPEPTYGIVAGLIHNTLDDGVWIVNVSGSVDVAPAYLINPGNQDDTYTVTIQGPAHWDVAFQPNEPALAKNGTRTGAGYGDVRHAMVTIQHNETRGEASEDDRVTISIVSKGDPDASADIVLAPRLADDRPQQVALAGDTVTIGYRGYFDDGEVFDPGNRPLDDVVVGGRGLVTGFSYGMAGLALGEKVTIRFPPQLGYGNDNPEGSRYAQFNNEWLNFDLEMLALPEQ